MFIVSTTLVAILKGEKEVEGVQGEEYKGDQGEQEQGVVDTYK